MTDEGLAFAGAELARHAPDLWRAFLHELDVHALEKDRALRHAPPDRVQSAQGVALEARILHDTLRDALTNVEKIRAANKARASNG